MHKKKNLDYFAMVFDISQLVYMILRIFYPIRKEFITEN